MATFCAFKLKNKIVSFEEYADRRANYEFIRDFIAMNNHSAFVSLVTA